MKSNVKTYRFSLHEIFEQDLAVVPNNMAQDKTFLHSSSSDSLVATIRVKIDSSITHLIFGWNDGQQTSVVTADLDENNLLIGGLLERSGNTIIVRHVYQPENGIYVFEKRVDISLVTENKIYALRSDLKIKPRGFVYYGDVAFRAIDDGDLIGKGDFGVKIDAFYTPTGRWSFDKGESKEYRILEGSAVRLNFDMAVDDSNIGNYKIDVKESDFLIGPTHTNTWVTDRADEEYQGIIKKTVGNGIHQDFIVELVIRKWVEILRPLPNGNLTVAAPF
tara:strand:+ start:96337 stop:97167 length:831 start_codon:yes stop_codon:yes gene_type:complete